MLRNFVNNSTFFQKNRTFVSNCVTSDECDLNIRVGHPGHQQPGDMITVIIPVTAPSLSSPDIGRVAPHSPQRRTRPRPRLQAPAPPHVTHQQHTGALHTSDPATWRLESFTGMVYDYLCRLCDTLDPIPIPLPMFP